MGLYMLVLVPFSGFLYLYTADSFKRCANERSRPLLGVLISLQRVAKKAINEQWFSSPSRGSYISTIKVWGTFHHVNVLVPFSGFL